MLRENMKYFLVAIMPVCDEYGINMCVHPDDPPFQVLGLPRIVTDESDIAWFLKAVNNPHNGLIFCAGSLMPVSKMTRANWPGNSLHVLVLSTCVVQLPYRVEIS